MSEESRSEPALPPIRGLIAALGFICLGFHKLVFAVAEIEPRELQLPVIAGMIQVLLISACVIRGKWFLATLLIFGLSWPFEAAREPQPAVMDWVSWAVLMGCGLMTVVPNRPVKLPASG